MKLKEILLSLIVLSAVGCGKPVDYISQEMLIDLENSITANQNIDPLIGIWRTSFSGVEMKVGIDLNQDEGEELKAVLINGDEVGFGFYNGHPSFYVSPTNQQGIYTGKMCYQNRFGFEKWFSTKIELNNTNIFTVYDDVPSHYLIYGGNDDIIREYIRIGPPRIYEGNSEKTLEEKKGQSIDSTTPIEEVANKSGTGFFITSDGYILTCLHIVDGYKKIEVMHEGDYYQAKLIGFDKTNDLAILKINGFFKALALENSHFVGLGDSVFTIGYPNPSIQGLKPKYTKGEISSLSGMQDDSRQFQISAPVQPGSSGGALTDESGKVIGMVVAKLDDLLAIAITDQVPQNVNYAVKSSYILAFVKNYPYIYKNLPDKNLIEKKNIIDTVKSASVLIISN